MEHHKTPVSKHSVEASCELWGASHHCCLWSALTPGRGAGEVPTRALRAFVPITYVLGEECGWTGSEGLAGRSPRSSVESSGAVFSLLPGEVLP